MTEFAGLTNNRLARTPNQIDKNSKKSMFSTSKVKKSQTFAWGLPVKIFPGVSKNTGLKLNSKNLKGKNLYCSADG
jgi:hypothetical protein